MQKEILNKEVWIDAVSSYPQLRHAPFIFRLDLFRRYYSVNISNIPERIPSDHPQDILTAARIPHLCGKY